MRQRNFRQAAAVAGLVLVLVLCDAWARRYEDGSGTRAGDPVSAPVGTLEVTAHWRYAPVPDDDVATTRQSYATLNARYREYQHAWQAYVMQLHHCQAQPPAVCASGPQQTRCQDRVLMQCLGKAVSALGSARGALHDQAIGLEQAAQQLADASG